MCKTDRIVGVLVLGVIFLGASSLSAATYYVSTSGNDANSGTSTAAPWRTVRYATQQVYAGDTVYVKAGLYTETAGMSLWRSGTAASPIVFEGYKTTPGDRPTYSTYTPGSALSTSEIPVIQGNNSTGSVCWGGWYQGYFTVRNMGVNSFDYAFFPQFGSYVEAKYLFVTNCGTSNGCGIYYRDCDHGTVENCTVTDASMQNYTVERTNNTSVSYCKSYSYYYSKKQSALPTTDYHYYIGDGQNNWVANCTAHNLHYTSSSSPPGHGFVIKDYWNGSSYPYTHSYGNTISNCIAYDQGEAFGLSHESYSNSIYDCRAYGHWGSTPQPNSWNDGIEIREGAHDNSVTKLRIQAMRKAIVFIDSVEGGTNQICTNNTLLGTVVHDTDYAIEIAYADNNTITGAVFDDAAAAVFLNFPSTRLETGNVLRNAIISNNTGSFYSGSAGSAVSLTYSDFWSNSFSMWSGTGNIAVDPLYVNAPGDDFHLKSTAGHWDEASSSWVNDTVSSPCIDAGDPADGNYVNEPAPNGGRMNIDGYGGTDKASKTP